MFEIIDKWPEQTLDRKYIILKRWCLAYGSILVAMIPAACLASYISNKYVPEKQPEPWIPDVAWFTGHQKELSATLLMCNDMSDERNKFPLVVIACNNATYAADGKN